MALPTDLLIVIDATLSMSRFLGSLANSVPELIHVAELTGCFERIAVLAYRDYCDTVLTEWSGWYPTGQQGQQGQTEPDTTTLPQLLAFIHALEPDGGGDFPEATKSGLALAFAKMRAGAETIILLYTDAPPHLASTGGPNCQRERLMLTNGLLGAVDVEKYNKWPSSRTSVDVDKAALARSEVDTPSEPRGMPPYGPHDAQFADWIAAANTLRGAPSDTATSSKKASKKARVYVLFEDDASRPYATANYTYLATRTGGACMCLPEGSSHVSISTASIALVLAVMGVARSPLASGDEVDEGDDTDDAESTDKRARAGWRAFQNWAPPGNDDVWSFAYFSDASDLDAVSSETSERAVKYLHRPDETLRRCRLVLSDAKHDLHKHLPASSAMLRAVDTTAAAAEAEQSPAVRYTTDPAYRAFVSRKLAEILADNAAAVTRNAVFGSLWRAVCNDRQNHARVDLLNLFSVGIDNISSAAERDTAKLWLENSYDFVGDVLAILDAVPAAQRFPCVYLDPTHDFSPDTAAEHEQHTDDTDDSKHGEALALTRSDLLEIGRSCDGRILRRIGRVLTRLSYAASAADLPEHIRSAVAANVRDPAKPGFLSLVPLALADHEHGRRFWGVLLHTIVPGTLLSARPAALVAALSLRMGIAALRDVADRELAYSCKVWNNIDIPETWNASCLNLLLAADRDYTARVAAGAASAAPGAVLLDADRKLFATLVDYKQLESNLGTSLAVRVGWTPNKTKAPMGPTAVCRVCAFPRSVTMMGDGGVCGLCTVLQDSKAAQRSPEEVAQMTRANVSARDSADTTRLWWVECCVRQCRAQYVVYNPHLLNARPKCWYCRRDGLSVDTTSATKTAPTPSSAPTVECTRCLSRIIWPESYRPSGFAAARYECPACVSGSVQTVVDAETTARALMAENGQAWLLRNDRSKIPAPFDGRSLFSTAKTAGTDGFVDAVQVLPLAGHAAGLQLTLNGKLVRNPMAVVDELRSWVSRGRAQGESCSLCFTAFYGERDRRQKLRRACGRRGCAQRVCAGCLEGWYGLNGRGRLLNIAALSCPFCRRQPAPATIAAVGNRIHTLGNLRDAVANAGTWVYGWCRDCGMAKEYAARECAQQVDGAAERLRDWRCMECAEAAQARLAMGAGAPMDGTAGARIKACPKCKTPTEKMGGCDHIACVVPGCGAHWCFFCAEEVSEQAIYGHMSKEHGGWFDGRDVYADDEYGDEHDEPVDV